MAAQPSVLHAKRADAPDILALIRELAEYEQCGSEVHATEQSLLDTLTFDDDEPTTSTKGYARTLILRAPPTSPDATPRVAGMALYFSTFSTWRSKPGIHLEDLYVRPEYRKRGYGKLLICALAKEVQGMGGARLEWSCLTWNEPSLQFYRGLGAEEMKEWVGLRVDGQALDRLAEGAI